MPLHNLDMLNRKRLEHWKHRIQAGTVATALSVSVVDHQAPAMDPADSTYEYEEHFLLANCFLDGHHRLQAASELDVPVRILAFLSMDYSLLESKDDFVKVVSFFS